MQSAFDFVSVMGSANHYPSASAWTSATGSSSDSLTATGWESQSDLSYGSLKTSATVIERRSASATGMGLK